MKRAIYPGSFDPFTNGHLDVLTRSCRLFDEVVVIVSHNVLKQTLFSLEERVAMIEKSISHLPNATVKGYHGLTLDIAKKEHACAMIRGIRQIKDYEYEMNVAACNHLIDASIETIFLFAKPEYAFLSSTAIKEFAIYGQSIHDLVPEAVEQAFKEKRCREQ